MAKTLVSQDKNNKSSITDAEKIASLEKLLTFALDNLSYLYHDTDCTGEELCDYDFCGICGRDEYSHKANCAGVQWTKETKQILGK